MAENRYWLLILLMVICGCRSAGVTRITGTSTITSETQKTSVSASGQSLAGSQQKLQTTENRADGQDNPIQQVAGTIPNQAELVVDGLPIIEGQLGGALEANSLSDVVNIALMQNPDLVALRQSEQVGVAAYGFASTYPFNPFLQVQATPYQDGVDGRTGTTSHYVLLMQRIQLAHQQQHREAASLSALNGIRWNIHQAELQAVSLTAQLYFSVLYQRGLLEVARDSQENNAQLFEVLTKRFNAGDAAAADVATVRVDLLSTRQQLQLAEANYLSALRNLRRQIGIPIDSPYEFGGEIREIRWQTPCPGASTNGLEMTLSQPSLSATEWIAGWAASRPDVLAAQANVDVAKASLRLATADRVPDVQIGPYYQADPDGISRLGFRADLNLPVINTGRPLENQRIAELRQQTTVWQQLRIRAELEAQAANDRYVFALQNLEQSTLSSTEELPLELQSLERQFREGEVDVVRVIQARTSILQNQRAHLDLLNEVAQSAALLVGASGISLECLVSR